MRRVLINISQSPLLHIRPVLADHRHRGRNLHRAESRVAGPIFGVDVRLAGHRGFRGRLFVLPVFPKGEEVVCQCGGARGCAGGAKYG